MFGVGVGIRVGGFTPISGGGGFDPDAQAFFDRVTTAGGTLTTTEKNATNQLVLDMKSAGIWSSMKAVYPMVGASAAACAQNLKSSSFTGTFTSGWTFASTGVTPNGTSAYMNTNFNPSVSSLLNSSHISFYSRSNSNALKCDMGSSNGTGFETNIFCQFSSYFFPRINGTNGGTPNSISSLGLFVSNRISSTEIRANQNGTVKILADNSVSLPNNSIYIGVLNSTTLQYFGDRQCAFSSIGDGLTDTQASNFYTAVQAFQTTLSRQV